MFVGFHEDARITGRIDLLSLISRLGHFQMLSKGISQQLDEGIILLTHIACAACGNHFTLSGTTKGLVDHDHMPGRRRFDDMFVGDDEIRGYEKATATTHVADPVTSDDQHRCSIEQRHDIGHR